tara:strand:+ start:167 stop:388 length:222 start_codon:yes stop_codon:yes gene_type:complete
VNNALLKLLSNFDLSQIFKTKGDLRRWSAKRSLGGLICITACIHITENDLTWQGVALAFVGVLPLCLSFYEKN